MLLFVHFSIAIILMGKRELVALLNLSFWCLVMVERLFLAVPRGCLRFVIVVFPDHTHLLFLGRFSSAAVSTITFKCIRFKYFSIILLQRQIFQDITNGNLDQKVNLKLFMNLQGPSKILLNVDCMELDLKRHMFVLG